jgi:hypothetical protein
MDRASAEYLRIPKTIHYCWFGGTPIRDDFAANIASWRKHCSDYEIVCWDESNYDYKKNEYMYEAYKHGKWGFASDYARLDIVHEHGGVYLDTDVEIIRSIDDLLCNEAYCGFQSRLQVNSGHGFGAVAGFPLIKELMEIYSEISFVNQDGTLNLTPTPFYITELLVKKGLKQNNTLQQLHGMTVYPSDVLSPIILGTGVLVATGNTYSIHHYVATWVDGVLKEARDRRINRHKRFAERFLGLE